MNQEPNDQILVAIQIWTLKISNIYTNGSISRLSNPLYLPQDSLTVCRDYRFLITCRSRNHHHHPFWQAPLTVRSAERRHQSPEWMVLSQVNCVVHIEVAGFQILLNGFHPCNTRTSQWSPPVSCGGSC